MSNALRKYLDDDGNWFCLEPLVPAMGPNDEMHRRAIRWFRVRDGNVEITKNWANGPNTKGSRLIIEIGQFRQMILAVGLKELMPPRPVRWTRTIWFVLLCIGVPLAGLFLALRGFK